MHVFGTSGERNSGSGSTRTVAAVSCLISASHADEPQKPPYADAPTTCPGASLGGHTRPLSPECVITRPPIIRVETPQDVFHTYSRPPAAVWYCTVNALAKFCPRLCDVPAWSALLSCISASSAYVRSAPANFSLSVFNPVITGIAIHCSWNVRYTPSICLASASASASVACAVCPSCHRNSVVRRNSRVRNSQRTMLHHWFKSSGRSRSL